MVISAARGAGMIALLATLVAVVRIGSTWRVFTETNDEAYHIACGMEWLATGQYTFEAQHPPLARIVAAAGPYLSGAKFHHQSRADLEGRLLLEEAPDYEGMLALARAGNLIFFLLACVSVWLLARELGGPIAASATVVLFTLIPVILGHAGVATTDMALAACLTFAYWTWQRWLQRLDDLTRAALAGFATALALVSKFSTLLFLPVALLPLLVFFWRGGTRPRGWSRPLALMTAICLFCCWAAYHFSVVPLRIPPDRRFLMLDSAIGSTGRLHDFAYWITGVPLPFTAMIEGIAEVFLHNRQGHPAYLLGQVSQHGWWYFFPLVLAIKTPLAFLILTAIGAAAAIRERIRPAIGYLAAALGIVVVCLPSNLNIGVRHILPVYLFLAPLAGLAVVRLWKHTRIVTGLLCVWMLAGSIMAHPDYLADFNLLALGKAEWIVADSDIDWGQDLGPATALLRQRGVQQAWVAYRGIARPSCQAGIVYRELPANTPVSGWVAASVSRLSMDGALARSEGKLEPYGWLKGLQPVMRAGRSILIYNVPANKYPPPSK